MLRSVDISLRSPSYADGTVNISGVVTGTQVGVFTANGYNSLEYSYVSGESFQIGQFGASVPTIGSVSFNVPIELVDGDGDTVTDLIGVTLSPNGQGIQDFSLTIAGVPSQRVLRPIPTSLVRISMIR